MRLGVHIRIANGLLKALNRALELGCESAQLFSGNPNSWAIKPLDHAAAEAFSTRCNELDISPVVLHTPYLVNLASPIGFTWRKSITSLADAVTRAPYLGAQYIVTHIGSHKGIGYEFGVKRIAEAVKEALDADPSPTIALELGAGSGNSIGSRFEHIADILELLHGHERVGICIDTAHLYGSGYDISTQAGALNMFDDLKKYVGFERLKVVHLNDTLMALGSHRDRHHHIAQGNVGSEGFRTILTYPGTQDLPGIIETPGETIEFDRNNLEMLRSLSRSNLS